MFKYKQNHWFCLVLSLRFINRTQVNKQRKNRGQDDKRSFEKQAGLLWGTSRHTHSAVASCLRQLWGLGREVKTVQLENGVQQKTIDVKDFQSGIYFYQIEIANEDNNGKLMIVK